MFYDALSKCEAVCEGEYDVGEEYPDEPTSFNQQIIGKVLLRYIGNADCGYYFLKQFGYHVAFY